MTRPGEGPGGDAGESRSSADVSADTSAPGRENAASIEPGPVHAPAAGTRRVSVRRRLPASKGGGAADVVGHVLREDADELVLLPENAGPVVVPRSAITAVRDVPEQAVRPSSSADKLERLLDRTWPGVERRRLGGWVLRASGGVTMRANSVLVADDPGVDRMRAIEIAAGFYAERDLPLALQVVLGTAGAPIGLPTESGPWTFTSDAHVLVADLRRSPTPASGGEGAWQYGDAPSDAWFSVWRGGSASPEARAEVTSAAATYLRLDDDTGAPVTVGRVAVRADWCVLSCLEVAPHRRREGLGRAATLAMLDRARGRGARFASLQVAVDNVAALTLYGSLGFTRHHTYAYALRG